MRGRKGGEAGTSGGLLIEQRTPDQMCCQMFSLSPPRSMYRGTFRQVYKNVLRLNVIE